MKPHCSHPHLQALTDMDDRDRRTRCNDKTVIARMIAYSTFISVHVVIHGRPSDGKELRPLSLT